MASDRIVAESTEARLVDQTAAARSPSVNRDESVEVSVEEVRGGYGNFNPRDSTSSAYFRSSSRRLSQADDWRRPNSQMIIDELHDALRRREEELARRNDELGVLCRILGDRSIRSNKRKFEGSSGFFKKKVGRWDSKKSDRRWCYACSNQHTGSCSMDTMRCRNCNRTGHVHATCKNPSVCYNCKESGHISRDCKKEKKVQNCFTCGEVGHKNWECPKNAAKKAK